MTPEQPTPDVRATDSKPRRMGRWGKLAFALLFVAAAAWLILHQRTHTRLGWPDDLSAALRQAADENRRVVALFYDSPQDYTFQRLEEILLKPGNIQAMEEAKVIRVAASPGRDDPLARKYGVRDYPTTLLIGPDGELIVSWVGYIGETDFRTDFLKGRPQP